MNLIELQDVATNGASKFWNRRAVPDEHQVFKTTIDLVNLSLKNPGMDAVALVKEILNREEI